MSGSIKTFFKRSLTHHEGRGYVRAVKLSHRNLDAVKDFIKSSNPGENSVEISMSEFRKYTEDKRFKLRVKTKNGWRVAYPGDYIVRFSYTAAEVSRVKKVYYFGVFKEKDFLAQYEQGVLYKI